MKLFGGEKKVFEKLFLFSFYLIISENSEKAKIRGNTGKFQIGSKLSNHIYPREILMFVPKIPSDKMNILQTKPLFPHHRHTQFCVYVGMSAKKKGEFLFKKSRF